MKIKPDPIKGVVHVTLSATEAMRIAKKLVEASIQSSPGTDWTDPQLTEESTETEPGT